VEAQDALLRHAIAASGCPGWIRADVRDAEGGLLLVSNPVYLLPETKQTSSCKGDVVNRQ
jgi:hypothetical protein